MKPSFSFVFWGRLSRQKGLDRSINFVKLLVDAGHQCTYDIWGRDDGELARLKELVEVQDLSKSVSFKGEAEFSKLEGIARHHCFYLQFSRSEGMAMAVVEAMQLGLVPVVTPVGEIGNYCVDQENAIVVRGEEAFAESIDYLVSAMGEQGFIEVLRGNAIRTWKNEPLYGSDLISSANQLSQANKLV